MHKQYYPRLDETLYRKTLANGLRVLVVPKSGYSRKIAYFVTDFGAIHRNFTFEGTHYTTPAGVAHYLEHKLFDLPGRDVSGEFAALGAMVNAFTSYDMTAYYFSCTEHWDECLKLLLEFVSTPYFTEESVEKERGIIDQEIGMVSDEPGSQVFEQLVAGMYRAHPIRVPILGTAQSIREITPEILTLCHRAFYAPGNMLLCVEGDVDPEAVCAMAEAVLGTENRPVAQKDPLPEEAPDCPIPLQRRSMDIAMPTFCLGIKCPPAETGEAGIRREVIADLAAEALFGESSALYLRLYGEGIIDSSFGGGFETVDGCSMLTCGGDSFRPEEVKTAILAQAGHLADTGISQEALLRMKRSALGRRLRDLDSFDGTCFRLCAYLLFQYDYFRFPEIYDSIRTEDILDFLRETVREDRCSLSVIDPLKED